MPTTLNSIMAEAQGVAADVAEPRRKSLAQKAADEAFGGGGGTEMEEPPTRPEVTGWYVYGLCTFFVQAFLLPVLFPLMVAQRALPASEVPTLPAVTAAGFPCHRNETTLYHMVVHRSIHAGHSRLSPLHWTAISWFVGVIIAGPVLPKIAQHLDHSYHQSLILWAGTSVGALVCLLTGFFKTTWLFPLYIAAVTVAITAASAVHTRHLALIVRGLASERPHRRAKAIVSSRMSLFATAFGSGGTAIIALFAYHMLRRSDHLTSLWVVSIFCGLKWFLGFTESFFANRPGSPAASLAITPTYWPQLAGRLIGVFLSSLSTTCIFTSTTLYIVGSLCLRPVFMLAVWMVYFGFSAIALPVLHPMQLVLRADPVKMNLLGFILSAVTAGAGFYFKDRRWHWAPVLLVALIQSFASGILHSFGRVMVLEPSPAGKEGVFSAWYEWVKVAGACAGFAVAAVHPDDVRETFGVSFGAVFIGMVVLIFGSEVRDFGGGSSRKRGQQHEKESEGASSSENGIEKSREYISSGERGAKQGDGSLQV